MKQCSYTGVSLGWAHRRIVGTQGQPMLPPSNGIRWGPGRAGLSVKAGGEGGITRWKLFSMAAAGGPFAAAMMWVLTGDDWARQAKLAYAVPERLSRDTFTSLVTMLDYVISLRGIPDGPEREKVLHECHLRGAKRLEALCFRNGGIYIKLGQHLGQLDYLLPEEYVKTMRQGMLNKCPLSSRDQVHNVFLAEFGRLPHELFAEFDYSPVASASLAQVHVGKTHDGQKVAVKVQHGHLTDTATADIATVTLVVKLVHFLMPSVNYGWLVDEVRESLPNELNFLHEAENSRRCRKNFEHQSPYLAPLVAIPTVLSGLSTSRVLTMEFMEGVPITDKDAIKKMGLNPADVARLLSKSFAEMIFHHGFVHCDPHGANVLVRRLPQAGRFWFPKWFARPQIVLLDHGLYRILDDSLRLNYASLWKALVFSDENAIREHSKALGAGEDLYRLFAGILTMRPWNHVIDTSIDHLKIPDTEEDKAQIQFYAAQYAMEVSTLLARLPRVLLLLLKTNDCLRATDNALGAPVNTFIIIARECTRALARAKREAEPGSLWLQCMVIMELMGVEVRIFALRFLAMLANVKLLPSFA
ncbi:hypothetical protein CBR_g58691 [Chara braunii]|uniref:ABC1 atypical kinase-like domain-containing protein n=1 Tax=Chara braunii TaxID=69332 RepID=A0A388MF14_CHABU|nr:hypothetical protein CBR_g58691 [Chara braunii]|eukprot:GBG93072.1 hypothetical protein CBR_g58691 [Chara braunii]